MNANGLPKLYPTLTAEERFKLILAASARGDEAERTRIGNAGPLMTLEAPDHYPFANAFAELGRLIFIELVEDAAFYRDTLDMVNEPGQNEAAPPQRAKGTPKANPRGEVDGGEQRTTFRRPGSGRSKSLMPPPTSCGPKRTAGSCFASG